MFLELWWKAMAGKEENIQVNIFHTSLLTSKAVAGSGEN